MDINVVANDITLKCSVTNNCIHIENSWRISKKNIMKYVLLYIMEKFSNKQEYAGWYINTGNINTMVNEWRGHNLLYKLGLFKSHTRDVDITNNNKAQNIIWLILSFIYI